MARYLYHVLQRGANAYIDAPELKLYPPLLEVGLNFEIRERN
jgi:hypothetical protein